MCKGIAKFYISIAHLYAAIVKTINPVYVYEDDRGKKHALSIQNRHKIPRGVTPKLTEINLCSKRVNALRLDIDLSRPSVRHEWLLHNSSLLPKALL